MVTIYSAMYASIVYSNFAWSSADARNFFADCHRARYLKSSFLANTPPHYIPLYAIQYTPQWSPVYITAPPSLAVFVTSTAYYVLDTSMLQQIVGEDKKDNHKIGSTNWLWDASSLEKGKDSSQRKEKYRAIKQNESPTLEDVYNTVVRSCTLGGLESSFTSAELQGLVPRPDPQNAAAAGTPLGTGLSGLPATRRGTLYPSRKRKHEDTAADDEPSTNIDHEEEMDSAG